MKTTRCLGCGATVPAQPGACRRCGFTRGTTAAQRIILGLGIFAFCALMALCRLVSYPAGRSGSAKRTASGYDVDYDDEDPRVAHM